MNWTIQDVDGAYIVVRTHGRYSAEAQREMVRDILSKPFWHTGMPAIFDHRELDFRDASYEVMRQAGQTHSKHDHLIGESMTAIVVDNDLAYGIVRQFEMLVDGVVGAKIRICRRYEDAEAWIKTCL